jgi:hypothetical protein
MSNTTITLVASGYLVGWVLTAIWVACSARYDRWIDRWSAFAPVILWLWPIPLLVGGVVCVVRHTRRDSLPRARVISSRRQGPR